MGRVWAITGIAFLISGCAMPVGVQMASYAIQGMTLAATDKTVTDHGISAIAQKDCALWRGLSGDAVCQTEDNIDSAIAMASADDDTVSNGGIEIAEAIETVEPAAAPSSPPIAVTDVQSTDAELANFSTAAGADVAPVGDKAVIQAIAIETVTIREKPATLAVVTDPKPVAKAGDLYFIIASFNTTERAKVLAGRYPGLSPEIVRAQANGRTVYRVAVGPFAPIDQGSERQRLTAAGITSAWAIRYDPSRWEPLEAPTMLSVDVAGL